MLFRSLLGDPRYLPYEDVKGYHGYNWYFARVDPASGYLGFDKTADGYYSPNSQPDYPALGLYPTRQNMDVPRFFQLFRDALLNANGVYHQGRPTGTFASFLLLGSDTRRSFFYASDPVDQYFKLIPRKNDGSWMARPWLGELYPDTEFSTWIEKVNLPPSAGFSLTPYSTFYSTLGYSAPLDFTSGFIDRGAGTFFNGKTAAAPNDRFFHTFLYRAGWANVRPTETDLMTQAYSYDPTSDASAISVFKIDYSLTPPTGYMDPEYAGTRLNLEHTPFKKASDHPESVVDSSPYGFLDVASFIKMKDPLDNTRQAHVVHLGMNTGGVWATSFELGGQLLWAFFRSCHDAVQPAQSFPPPFVRLDAPAYGEVYKDPAAINVQWTSQWTRFDGQPYTPTFPVGWSPAGASILVNLKYSSDGGSTWKFADTHTSAVKSVYDPLHPAVSPISWNVAGLVDGTYVLRVEAFTDKATHYGHHTARVRIQR